MDRLMERQLDAPAAALLKRALEARGIEVLLNAATTRFIGDSHVAGVELKDGRVLAADTVVAAVGIKPNAEVAARAGIAVNRGIVVDDHVATNKAGRVRDRRMRRAPRRLLRSGRARPRAGAGA